MPSNPSSNQRRGIKTRPRLDCIDVDRIIVPLMHSMMGISNFVLDSWCAYLLARRCLAPYPDEVLEARKAEWDTHAELLNVEEALGLFVETKGGLEGEKRAEKMALTTLLKTSRRILKTGSEERLNAEERKAEVTKDIMELNKEWQALGKAVKAASGNVTKMAAARVKVEKSASFKALCRLWILIFLSKRFSGSLGSTGLLTMVVILLVDIAICNGEDCCRHLIVWMKDGRFHPLARGQVESWNSVSKSLLKVFTFLWSPQ